MALKVTNIDELKYYKDKLQKSKNEYDETINKLLDTIKVTAIYWQGVEAEEFRLYLYSLIGKDLNCISKEMEAELNYVNKLAMVLENAQEQVKNRLNG